MTEPKKRTLQQNKALHVYFQAVSEEAKNTGITYSEFIRMRPKLEMPWTAEKVKDLWKIVQNGMYGTDSTKNLTRGQIDAIYDVLNKGLGEILGFTIPFPSADQLNQYESNRKTI